MRGTTRRVLAAIAGVTVAASGLSGQDTVSLFVSDEPLELTLRADFEALRGDRAQDTPERPATVAFMGEGGTATSLDVQLRTRGRFRLDRANCSSPPLRINFKKKQVEGTVFEGQDKMKIVGSCRPNRDSYERLVLREYLAYRALQTLTETSFRVRLARITYEDTSGKNETQTRFAFFIEDDDALAARVGANTFSLPEGTNLPPGALDAATAARVALFEYMIGNTDWSDVAAHNVEVLDLHGIGIPVPYDFDFSGMVDAPYANPDPSLNLRSVRQRLYRGWCVAADLGPILEEFRRARPEIEALYLGFPHLDEGERMALWNYVGGFFEEIETDDRAERLFLRDCRALPQVSP